MAHRVNYVYKPFSAIYDDTRDLLGKTDLTFANLEFPVDDEKEYSTYPSFNVNSPYVEEAIIAGCNVFSMANNHSADRGLSSIKNTVKNMNKFKEEKGIFWSGIRNSKDVKFSPILIEKNGLKIGFIAVTQFSNADGYHDYVHIVNYRKKKESDEFLQLIKEHHQNYDLFIVSYHGGEEYTTVPVSKKKSFFIEMMKAGADIVYGHHPHVLQKPEIFSINGERKIILYSCGNFISGQTWYQKDTEYDTPRAWTGDSAIFEINFSLADGKKSMYLDYTPISNYIDKKHTKVYKFDTIINTDLIEENWTTYYQKRFEQVSKLLTVENEIFIDCE